VTPVRLSVAMTAAVDETLAGHLLRSDGQEDVCLALYAPSTGRGRWSALVRDPLLPEDGEREVHGNASFTGGYVLRAAGLAAEQGLGVAVLHSHPGGDGWQGMSSWDDDGERSYARLVATVTGLPLVGMTLAGDRTWSARAWDVEGDARWCESVRVVGAHLRVAWNDDQRPVPAVQETQARTVSAWGERTQAGIARLRVLVVGPGSVGLDVGLRLAATGIEHVAVMDFDSVDVPNLDRLVGATRADVGTTKTAVAARLMRQTATHPSPDIAEHNVSVCEPDGHAAALDYDVIFSCVDRPWPRAVLNSLAYTDLIPVVDGGIAIDAFDDGTGMRNATWRTHVLRPGRPCMVCNGQLDPARVTIDRQGLLDDPTYIAGAGAGVRDQRQNVAALAAGVSGSMLSHFVGLVAAPSGIGETGPVRFSLTTGRLEHLTCTSKKHCTWENSTAAGDRRSVLTGPHAAAERARADRDSRRADGSTAPAATPRSGSAGVLGRLRRFLRPRREP
jgi:molybdopterin-synthase adenylyltransferase